MFLMKEKDKVYEAKFILYLVHRTFSENVASFRMDTIVTSQPHKINAILFTYVVYFYRESWCLQR